MKICATGDLMLLEKFPKSYQYQKIKDVIDGCDVKITNLESVISNFDCFASTFCGGQWINSTPEVFDDALKFDFNLFGCANNHSMDYSFDGLLSTYQELSKRKLSFAGIGKSLDESSAPAVLNFKNAKIAFISVTSTFVDSARAGNAKDPIPARPGVNPLRVKTKYIVTQKHFDELQEIAKNTYLNGERDNARKIGSLPKEEKNSLNFGGQFFVVGKNEGKSTCCDDRDLYRILKEIKKAKEKCDYCLVSVHSHQIKKTSYTEPDYFLEEFAHACIDAGANAIIGSGTHQLKPIEIYQKKPIFYSLGNFIFESGKVKHLPADFWDKYRFDQSLSMKDALNIKTKNGTIGLETDKNNYLSVLPIMEFKDGALTKLDLLPISLSFEEKTLKGLPVPANLDDAETIYHKLRAISQPYNTQFSMNNNQINVKLINERSNYGSRQKVLF